MLGRELRYPNPRKREGGEKRIFHLFTIIKRGGRKKFSLFLQWDGILLRMNEEKILRSSQPGSKVQTWCAIILSERILLKGGKT